MAWFDISLETANKLYLWGWRGSLLGASLTALSVIFLMWGTRVRDHDAERQFADLNFEAGRARERASKLEERAAAFEKEAAQARLETERLREQMAWRRLTPKQGEILSAAIRKTGLKPVIFVTTTDPEASSLRDDFVAVLRAAGDMDPHWSVGLAGGSFAGLAISGPQQEKEALGLAFNEAELSIADGGNSDKLTIIIGARPPINP